ncbi:MAG: cyclic nucleotide-binding domain-containing protein [Lachnospiraceae bacterium]|nr:cyclic nucleotide-binding domain-containing protein [Lachnospiraceae bacterium]
MGLLKLEKGQILHKAGQDVVSTLEILIKGSIKISNGFSGITVGVGAFIGIVETPGQPYTYTIEAVEESAVYSYPFESEDDIPKVVKSNPKIAPILASQAVENAASVCAVFEKDYDDALSQYEQIMADFSDYPNLCIKVGETPKLFPEIEELSPPEKTEAIPEWEIDYVSSLKENDALLKKGFYTASVDICTGVVMTMFMLYKTISGEVQKLNKYRKDLAKKTASFAATMKMINAKLEDQERAASGEGDGTPTIVNALSTILAYSGVASEIASAFEEQINTFKANENRYDSSDELRALRRRLGVTFYDVYKSAFLKSLNDRAIPIELRMFFMFGFVDEDLAGEKNTQILYNTAKAYVPDPEGCVLTLYEWLVKIYNMEVEPSRNEFDQDWPTYLKEQKTTGGISQEEADKMANDPKSRLDFEFTNLFSLGNRMTFGRVSSFVPVFDQQNVLRPLNMAYITSAAIHDYFAKIRSLDYGVFCRQAVYSNTKLGIPQLFYADDITPYMILMPNVGSRASLWQEIEGKNRRTKARMIISMFNVEKTEECMIRLFGEFRWEMCKTEQGVHWNDVTDPSLTSLYCDYLQFYKKNSALSPENREKVKTDLKKYSNNYKNVFIADYLQYIKYESNGSPRLNKVAREIMFTFCPFTAEYRAKLGDSPQYSDLLNQYNLRTSNAVKPFQNIIGKLNKAKAPIPPELTGQIEFLQK